MSKGRRWGAAYGLPGGWRYPIAVVGLGLAVGLTIETIDAGSAGRSQPPAVQFRSPDRDPRIKTFVVDPVDDVGKAGRVRGVMGWRFFEIPAGSSGPSPNQLRFRFAAPAEILQIDISVDIGDSRATLVEFAAAINARDGYGLDRRADWLMHASWTRGSSRDGAALDETTQLPPGVRVAKGDFLALAAWLGGEGGGSPIRVSPEVVVLYRWLSTAAKRRGCVGPPDCQS